MHEEFRRRAIDLLMMVEGDPLPFDRFWALVDAIAWKESGAPHAERLAAAGLRETVLAYLRFAEISVELQDALESWRGGELRRMLNFVEFVELCWHVIGLGRAEFDAIMANPARAEDRARRRDFRQGFSSVFRDALERFSDDDVRTELVAAYVPREWIDGERWTKNTLVRHEQWGLGIVDMGALKGVRVIFEGKPRILPGLKPYRE